MRRRLPLSTAAAGAATSLLLLVAVPPGSARADDIGDAIAEAGRAWAAGDGVAARTALEEAVQLLAQKAAGKLAEALPAPLAGWQAEDVETSAAATVLFGAGGTQASRRYANARDQSVHVELTTDSPVIAQLAMIYSNPALAGTMGKLIRVGPLRAIQENDGDVQMLVDSRVLVSVSGDAPADAKLAYARAVDQAKLARH
jgi:hypothetical protein